MRDKTGIHFVQFNGSHGRSATAANARQGVFLASATNAGSERFLKVRDILDGLDRLRPARKWHRGTPGIVSERKGRTQHARLVP